MYSEDKTESKSNSKEVARNEILRIVTKRGAILQALVSSCTPMGGQDVLRWRWMERKIFTVRSLYNFLTQNIMRDPTRLQIQKLKIPVKVKIFIGLLLRNRMLTKHNLVRRGWMSKLTCVLCEDELETTNYLLHNCGYSKQPSTSYS